jgi:sulfate adenylyltransferase
MKSPFLLSNGKSPDASPQPLLMRPHGGELIQLIAAPEQRQELMKESAGLASLQISAVSAANLAMLAAGAFSPLDRFAGRQEYENIAETMRLTTGELCPVPVTLPAGDLRRHLDAGSRIALRDLQNRLLALMTVEDVFEIPRNERNRQRQLALTGRRTEPADPWVLSGPLQVFNIPADLQLPDMWKGPAAVRERLASLGRQQIVAVDRWDARDRKQTEWLRQVVDERNASLLLNLAEGESRLDAFDHFHHMLVCKAVFSELFSPTQALLNFVHLAPALPAERQILWHAIVHKNYGATTYIVDDARCRRRPYDSESRGRCIDPSPSLLDCAAELGVELIFPPASLAPGKSFLDLNGSSAKTARGSNGSSSSSPRPAQEPQSPSATLGVPSDWGLCVWFTGLPSAGKSAIAEELLILLMESGLRVTLLDGDTVRTHLSKGLSFSREDRDTNVQRIGFVASEIVRHRGVVICAAVSPYRDTRNRVREMMPEGSFVEVFVDTPVEECERRDVKGFYAKARAGQLSQFTGIDDPYEPPLNAEIVLRTEHTTVRSNALELMQFLRNDHYLDPVPEIDEMWRNVKATGNSARAGR